SAPRPARCSAARSIAASCAAAKPAPPRHDKGAPTRGALSRYGPLPYGARMDRATRDFYQHRAAAWAAALPFEWSPWLDAFLDRLPAGARILELGCGDGREAARMIARGFEVVPSDGTPEMARLASERLGREVPVMRFDELDAREEFDAVWSQAALLHVPEAELPDVLARVHRALKPGG